MKRSMFVASVGMFLFTLLAVADSFAQSGAPASPRSNSDQVIQELLSEVHQLRVAVQHMSVNAYRGQIMVERLRLQQDQVSRVARELNDVRNGIAEMKGYESVAKERLEDAEKQFDRGLVSEAQVKEIRANTAEMKRRQQSLMERETQLSIELEQERNNLADFNKRLDALEREILTTGLVTDEKTNPKQ